MSHAQPRAAPRSLEQGPCPIGYTHAFDGYMSCALDTPSCASKVLSGSATHPVLMDDCATSCNGCLALSLYESTECWIYTGWAGQPKADELSVICKRDEPPPPLPPPPPPPPPIPPSPPPPVARHVKALNHLNDAKDDLKAAGFSLIDGIPPMVLGAAGVALGLLALLLLACGCVCMRRRQGGGGCCGGGGYDDDDDDDDDDDEELGDDYGSGGGRRGSQRVLVECGGGEVSTTHVKTGGCRTLRALRRKVAVGCEALTGWLGENGMILEYLDEAAGLAIRVTDAELATALRMGTLKATFSGNAAPRGRAGPLRALKGAGRPRGRRRGYLLDNEEEEDMYEGGRAAACVLQ